MRRAYIVLFLTGLAAVILGSTLFSYSYEPLDTLAEKLNLTQQELFRAPLPEYTVPGLPDWLGGLISGLIGIAAVLLITLLLGGRRTDGNSQKAQ